MTNIDEKIISDIIHAIDASKELSKNVLGEIQSVRKMQEIQDNGDIDRIKEDIKTLNKIVKGNGEEGLIVKQIRVEEKTKNIENLISDIEENLSGIMENNSKNIEKNLLSIKNELDIHKKNDVKIFIALLAAISSLVLGILQIIFR